MAKNSSLQQSQIAKSGNIVFGKTTLGAQEGSSLGNGGNHQRLCRWLTAQRAPPSNSSMETDECRVPGETLAHGATDTEGPHVGHFISVVVGSTIVFSKYINKKWKRQFIFRHTVCSEFSGSQKWKDLNNSPSSQKKTRCRGTAITQQL